MESVAPATGIAETSSPLRMLIPALRSGGTLPGLAGAGIAIAFALWPTQLLTLVQIVALIVMSNR